MWSNVWCWWCVVLCGAYVLQKVLSDKPNKVKFHSKFLLYYFYISVISIIVIPIFLLRPKYIRNVHITAFFMKPFNKVINIRWELRDEHILSQDRAAVVVSNHQSSLDILGMGIIWPVADKLTAIAKKELFYIWPFGLSSYLAGVIFIDRTNHRNAYKQLKIASDLMVEKQTKLWVFPEGTRNKNSTRLLPFKRGAFTVAVSAQVPIIPVVYSPYYFINEQKNIFSKGQIIIKCLDPVPTTGLTKDDIPNLINRVYELMQTEYNKLAKEVLDPLPPEYPLASFFTK